MKRLALVGMVVALSGCWLPPGDYTTPEYWGQYFLDQFARELELGALEAGPEPLVEPRTVLLITGVTIPARWFEPIAARLRRDGFNPVVYEPPALLSYDLFEASADLAEVVERVQAGSGQERIDILAECTGGLIARHYIQSLGGEAKVDRLVTFVSPQHGVDKAPWAEALVGWPALRDLTPGSVFLNAVNEAPMAQTTDVTSIFSCSDEYIQPQDTSIIPGAANIGLCDGTVGHFQMFYDPDIYLIMHSALVRTLRNPPVIEEAPPVEAPEVEAPPPGEEAPVVEPPAVDPPMVEPPVEDSPVDDEVEPELGVAPPGLPEGPAPDVGLEVDPSEGCMASPGRSSPSLLGVLLLAGLVARRRVRA